MLKATLLVMTVCATQAVGAVGLFFHADSITGPEAVPGFPNSVAATRVKVTPEGSAELKRNTDATSPQFLQAVANGTPLGTTDVLIYDTPIPAGAPDAHLFLPQTMGSAYQSEGPTETVSLNFAGIKWVYLEMPGVVGEHDVPGHPNVMRLDSWLIDAAGFFEITRPSDSASPALFLAAGQGTHFPDATVLFYNADVPGPQPDASIRFEDVLISAYQQSGGASGPPTETVTFSFISVPEPGMIGIAAAATGALLCRSRRIASAGVRRG